MITRTVRMLKDDIYQLVEIRTEPYGDEVIFQGTLPEVDAYVSLESRGLM